MPKLFSARGFRFFFYSNEKNEPCHVHVKGHGGEAKFWMPGCEMVFSYRLSAKDIRNILEILRENASLIEEGWNEFFKSGH